jgi:hypothetical protein
MGGRLNFYGGYTMIAPTSTGTRSGEVLVKGILKSLKCDDRYRNTTGGRFSWSDKYKLIALVGKMTLVRGKNG